MQSFSSYLRGVASLHVVPVSWLFSEFIAEPLRHERGQRHPIVQATRATESVNGATPGSARLVARAAEVFGQPRLVETTLIALGPALECREAFHTFRAWCPSCIRAGGEHAYDRLYWTLRCVGVCVAHSVQLRTRCASCLRPHRPLHRLANPWSCPHCGADLAKGVACSALDPVSIAAYALVSAAAAAAPIDPDGVATRIAIAIERAGSGQQLAELLGVTKSTVSALRSKSARPHFHLFARLDAWLSTGIKSTPVDRRHARSGGQALTDAALRRALRVAPPPSLRGIAGTLGTTSATLQRTLPRLAQAVVLRRRASVLRAAALRRRRVLLTVSGSIRALQQSGRPLSRRALEACLGAPGVLRAPEARDLYATARANSLAPRRQTGIGSSGGAPFGGRASFRPQRTGAAGPRRSERVGSSREVKPNDRATPHRHHRTFSHR